MASARLVARHRAGAVPGLTLTAGGALVVPVQGDGVALFDADSLVRDIMRAVTPPERVLESHVRAATGL